MWLSWMQCARTLKLIVHWLDGGIGVGKWLEDRVKMQSIQMTNLRKRIDALEQQMRDLRR